MTETLTLHEYALSGDCYKIRLTAAHVQAWLTRVATQSGHIAITA
jgi:hypothetical protein